jgi:hypothetical protein
LALTFLASRRPNPPATFTPRAADPGRPHRAYPGTTVPEHRRQFAGPVADSPPQPVSRRLAPGSGTKSPSLAPLFAMRMPTGSPMRMRESPISLRSSRPPCSHTLILVLQSRRSVQIPALTRPANTGTHPVANQLPPRRLHRPCSPTIEPAATATRYRATPSKHHQLATRGAAFYWGLLSAASTLRLH